MVSASVLFTIAACIAGSAASIADCVGENYAGVCMDAGAPGLAHDGLTRSCCQPPHGSTYNDGPGVFCCVRGTEENIKYLQACCSASGKRDVIFNHAGNL
ncbi:hypothetical protein CKAH01_15229 [Colletotrichum kahawae]|uniref:Uncharacterized protein n=1 Tax=Colletotrichum kahawae TaxID=34407 RepID=A0AAE0D8T2_COLKA|nr:hypothetical protein CKAH01_15229 [Colletotrichum kahawae]